MKITESRQSHSAAYEYAMARQFNTKEFGGSIAIDPAGCGCVDCIIGSAIPFDYSNSDLLADLAVQVAAGKVGFIDRSNAENLQPYVGEDGDAGFAEVEPAMTLDLSSGTVELSVQNGKVRLSVESYERDDTVELDPVVVDQIREWLDRAGF